jgi:hypothetical protein
MGLGSCRTHGKDKCIQNFVGKPEVKQPLENLGIVGGLC